MAVAAIQGALASLKAASGVVRSLLDLKVTAEVHDKVIALQGTILEAQTSAIDATTAQYELQERVRDLETQLAACDHWEKESQRYALVAMWGGPAQAFALRREAANGESPHLLCPQCFASREKGMLAPAQRNGNAYYVCPKCNNAIDTGNARIGEPEFAEVYIERNVSRRG